MAEAMIRHRSMNMYMLKSKRRARGIMI